MKEPIRLNHIYNENCIDTMRNMPDGFIDMIIASPPYDDYRLYNGFTFDFEAIAIEANRVLKPGGVIVWVVNDQIINGSESGTSFRQALFFMSLGLNLHDTMIYSKDSIAFPEKIRYYQVFEYMFVFSKGKPKSINLIEDRVNKWAGHKVKGHERGKDGNLTYKHNYSVQKDKGVRYNIWQYSTGGSKSSKDPIAYGHPAIFPEKLAADHIYSWSNEGDIVYDPFMGSGTTAKMAHIQKRNWIGSEISAEYVAIANKRLEKHLQQTHLF